jgi:hypothetical protein
LEFSFVAFKKEFIEELTTKGLIFLSLATTQPQVFSSILLLHHPKGKDSSLSRGIVKCYEDSELHHISCTAFGSAGAPILNERHEVIGIHKGTGPLGENSKPLYKTGTRIAEIVRHISEQRLVEATYQPGSHKSLKDWKAG